MDFKNYNVVDGFNTIAPAYDLANDAMTFGLHRWWRRSLCRRASQLTPKNGTVLDLATGTGDVVLGLIKSRGDIKITGLDPSEGMLRIAVEKMKAKAQISEQQVEMKIGDARELPFPDNTFDTVTICWGIRNVKPFSLGLREMLRVLKPGGSVVVLESGRPEFKIVETIYKQYSKLLPYIGQKISGFKPAYQYYAQTVDTFPSGRNFVAELLEAGFTKGNYSTLGASIVYLYTAQKPMKK